MIGKSPIDDGPRPRRASGPGRAAGGAERSQADLFQETPCQRSRTPRAPRGRTQERDHRGREQGRRRRAAAAQRLNVVKVEEQAKTKKTKGSIAMRDIVIFTRQFSTMINSGLPLVQALDILSQAVGEPGAAGRDAAGRVRRGVGPHGGRRALRKHPKPSAELYVNMVAPARRAVSWTPS
jgi:type II secretory pathway component PulF